MNNNSLTYEKSGVNIKAADNFVKFITSLSKKRSKSKNFQNIGGFGSINTSDTAANNTTTGTVRGKFVIGRVNKTIGSVFVSTMDLYKLLTHRWCLIPVCSIYMDAVKLSHRIPRQKLL